MDQVQRRMQFQQRHPDMHIEHHGSPLTGYFSARWLHGGQWAEARDTELSGLLDQLEQHFGEEVTNGPGSGPADRGHRPGQRGDHPADH